MNKLVPFLGEDGSQTFFSTKYNEAYHSKIGPLKEAEHKFVLPSCIKDLVLNNQKVRILDLFFGLGYNSGFALHYADDLTNLPNIEIIAVEISSEIVKEIREIQVPLWYVKWRNLLSSLAQDNILHFENITISLYLDNVFNVFEKLPRRYFDIIFFDPFSHKSTPEFWTSNFLSGVFELLADGGTLTTYSSLKAVENLANQQGYITKKITPIGRKKSSLLIKRFK